MDDLLELDDNSEQEFVIEKNIPIPRIERKYTFIDKMEVGDSVNLGNIPKEEAARVMASIRQNVKYQQLPDKYMLRWIDKKYYRVWKIK